MTEPRRRRSPKGERRRAEIIAAATELFARDGIDKTSMQGIADATGLTKAAVHHHFPEKEALYEAVVLTRVAETYALVLAATDLAPDPEAKLRAYVFACAKRIEDDLGGWIATANLVRSLTQQERSQAVITARDRFERHLRDIIEAGIAEGTLKPVDPATLGRLILGALNAIPRWYRPDGRQNARAVAEAYLEIILDGVRAH